MTTSAAALRVGVVVPSYRRPDDLAACLATLAAQQRAADEVVVVLREDDDAGRRAAASAGRDLPLRVVAPAAPGFVPALRAGLAAATTDVVACTDDDARPRPDWLARIAAGFREDPDLAALGGRDARPQAPTSYRHGGDVGSLSWWGRMVGRHEESWPEPTDVAHLRGANMAFRAPAPLPDAGLRGDGTANEADMCLAAGLRGRVRYDPALVVDHLVSPRPGSDADGTTRGVSALRGAADRASNVALVLAKHTPATTQRAVRLGYLLMVGHRASPGPVRVLVTGWPGSSRVRAATALARACASGWRAGSRARAGVGAEPRTPGPRVA
ncbi:glycosyltransferase [uncultured Pseudokineococcus sp.]|uniref:glycosyltransferase n=1 Tax=uncultured Pseudokineococcus sp. TaxID=1642928 RepID=UPI00261F2949|nr:glycosyltransferase [uncultured Pseudokineococcus sp.]